MSSWQTLVDEAEEMIRDEGQGAITRIYIDLPDIGWRYVSHIGTEGPSEPRSILKCHELRPKLRLSSQANDCSQWKISTFLSLRCLPPN